ncbi:hypothetical protein PGTUg99_013519 [Puccinia graminis f. sp. tritici]|uniref:Uncharacterized protein n=1 Tax=Puccinia graminis f. sp. tritici TaxID=56615 RepID=A0A5B0R7T4_PUCGR|nr:hypothetical protein PGTUg99_013519 [Puccinia graminis f. sp. tritici]
MFFQTPSRLLLVVGIALCLYTAESSAESVCYRWWKTLPSGSRTMTVKLMKRTDNHLIKSQELKAPKAKLLGSGANGGACGKPYGIKDKGICLWAGTNSKSPIPKGVDSGWVTGGSKQNCGKTVSITSAKGRTSQGTVLDVCTFDEASRKLSVEVGCSMMYVSLAVSIAFNFDILPFIFVHNKDAHLPPLTYIDFPRAWRGPGR